MPPKSSKGPLSRRSFLIAQEHNILTMTAGQAQVNITVRRETHVSLETLLSRICTLVTGMFARVKMVVVGVSDQHETGYNQGYSEIKQAACFMLMSDACEIASMLRIRSCKIMSTSMSIPGTKAFRIFTAEEGADAHCQLNNLGLMQQVVFDWLGEVFTN